MSLQEILLAVVAVLILLAIPAALVWASVDHVKNNHKRPRKSGSGGVGFALQELDRMVARPSVEHTAEAERPVLRREDDQGGD
jgi:hypothetical protein